MAPSTVGIFLSFFLSVSAEIQLNQVCQMNDALALCVYSVKGVYGSSVVVPTTTRIQFDRLTESRLSLKNLPNVNLVTLDDNPFEQRTACQLIINNARPVIVQLGNQPPVKCPSDNLPSTVPDKTKPSRNTEAWTTQESQTLSFETKSAETPSEITQEGSTDTTLKGTTMPVTQDLNDYIIIIISLLSAFVVAIICIIITILMCRKCRRRRGQPRENLELGVRFGELPRHFDSEEEETVFVSPKRD